MNLIEPATKSIGSSPDELPLSGRVTGFESIEVNAAGGKSAAGDSPIPDEAMASRRKHAIDGAGDHATIQVADSELDV